MSTLLPPLARSSRELKALGLAPARAVPPAPMIQPPEHPTYYVLITALIILAAIVFFLIHHQ